MNSEFTHNEIFCRGSLLMGDDVMDALSATRVILFGVGGVGSWAAESLVRSGIGYLTIVDDDAVAVSNINRQLPATTATVGQPKVEVMRRRLLEINPAAQITALQTRYTPDSADEFALDSYDYVLDAIDSLPCKAHLISEADRLRLRLFSSMGAALKLTATKISVAEFRKVQGCPLARALRQRFKRQGTLPRHKFMCVYSPEVVPNRGPQASEGERANGSLVHATAIFGNMLAGLVVEDVYRRITAPAK